MKALSFLTAISLLLSFLTPVVSVAAAPAPATVAAPAAAAAAHLLPAWMSHPSASQPAASSAAVVLPAWMQQPASVSVAAANPAATFPAWFEAKTASAPQASPVNAPLRIIASNANLRVYGPSEVNVCDTVTYTVVITNDATLATNVVITSAMPFPYSPSPQTCSFATIEAGGVRNCTFAFAGGCLAVSGQNVVTLTQAGGPTIVRYTDLVVNPGAITVRKEPAVQEAYIEDVVTWTVYVENTGYGDVVNVVITDVLGSGLSYVSGLTSAYIPTMSVGQVITFPVSAQIMGCANLDNVVTATWGCNGESCLLPQTATGAVDLQMRNPDLAFTLPGFDVPFCAGQQTFTVPITNVGDGTAYTTTLTTDLSSTFSVTTDSEVTYDGDAFHLPLIAPGETYDLVFTLTLPSDVCTTPSGGTFNFDIDYYDICDNPYFELPQSASWQLVDVPGDIGLSKSMPVEVYRGETVTATITVDVSGISGTVIITDTIPDGWTILDADGGTVFTIGDTTYITWSVSASTTFDIVLLTPSDTITGCAACGTQMTNVVAAWGTDCQDCVRTASASASTYIQCDDGITSNKQVSVPLTPCSDDTFTYTNTYVFGSSFNVTPTWGGLVFTETLEYQIYVTGTAAVWVSTGPISCAAAFSESTAGGQLVITNISPNCAIDLPGATLQIVYQTRVGEPAACSDFSWYDWSYLNLGVTGNDACAYDGVLQEGVFVETRAPQMQLTMSGLPSPVSSCGAYTVTLTAERTTPDIAAYDAVIDLMTDTFAVVTVVGFDGALPVLTETNSSGYHWYYGDAFTTALTATVQLYVQLRCTDAAPFTATLHYDNLCADDDVYRERCSDGGALGNPLVAPCSPILTKFPEVIYATDDIVVWSLTVYNAGAGPAYNVTLTDTLGSGLRYVDSTITSTQGSVAGVTPITSAHHVTWTLPVIQPKERVTLRYYAEIIGCDDLTNIFGGEQGCQGEACMQGCAAPSRVELPPTVLLNTNQFVSPIDTCYTRTVTVTVRNAGLLSVYSATVQQTLPPGLYYVPGTTQVSTDTVNWQPGPDPTIVDNQLSWGPSGAPLDVWLARVRPNETVYIRYDTTASCPFAGGQMRVQTAYIDPCGVSHLTQASSYLMQSRTPELTFTKVGQHVTRTHPIDLVYGEPGETVVWTITVANAGSASPATNVVVTDTLPYNAGFVTATTAYPLNAPPLGTLGATLTWTLGTVSPGQTVVLTVTSVISDPEGCDPLDARNAARLTWGCADGCRLEENDDADLRTVPVFDAPGLGTDIAPNTLNQCGGVLTATLVNNGPPAYNVVLTDTLPTGFVYSDTVYASTPPAGVTDLGGRVVYTWGELPTGVTTIAFRVRNAESAGDVCALPSGDNVIEVLYDDDAASCLNTGPYMVSATQAVNIVSPTLTIDKSPPSQTVDVGEPVTWTLTLQNIGSGMAYNVVVTDVVGTNYVNVNADVGSDGTTPVVAGNAITWTLIGPLAVAASWTATVTAILTDTGDNTNRAWVQGGCDTGCVTSSAYDEAHTTLLEEFGKSPVIQTSTIGSPVVFTVTARLSDWDALYENVILTDTLPVGLGYVSSVLTYTYDQDQGGTTVVSGTPTLAPGASASGSVVWRLGDLPGTVQINGVITAVIQNIPTNQDGVRLTNRVDITYIDDGVLYAQTDTADVDILEPNLVLNKRLTSSTGSLIGLDGTANLTYTLVITSDGNWPAYDVLITDAVPSGIYVTGIEGGDSRSLATARPLTWTFAVIPTNTVVVVTYTAYISGASPNVNVTNVATVTWTSTPDDPVGEERDGYEGPGGPLDDYADEDSETLTTAALTFDKQVTPSSTANAPLRVGDVVTYTIVTIVPRGVYVPWPFQYDDLPAGVRYVVGTFAVTSTMPFIDADPLAQAASYDSTPNGVLGGTLPGDPSHNTNPYVGRSEASAVIETIEWWLDPLDNSASATPGYVTVTFQAQLTGIGRNGAVQWADPQAANLLNNTARLYWNNNDGGAYNSTQPYQTLVDIVPSYVGQPLVHINKTYVTPAGCNALLLEDAFNRASTTPPTGWTAVSGGWNMNATPGYAQQSASANPAILVRTDFVADDFSYSAMILSTDGTSSRGLVFRYTAGNYYRVRLRQVDDGTNVSLEEVGGGAPVLALNSAFTPITNRWYHVEARVETVSTGVRIRVYIDGQQYFDVVDTSPRPAGSVGFYANICANNACRFDDVYVTRLEETSCTVGANDLVTYTLTISNQGRTPAYDIVISDVLPSELTFVNSALLSPPTPANSAFLAEPVPGDTGTLVWVVDVLSGTSPAVFNYGNQKTLQIQVVARVTDTVSANIRFSNQVFLPYYDSQPGDGPTGTPIASGTDADQRAYSDGSHSAGLQTVNAGIAKTVQFGPPPTATLGTLVTYTLIVPATPISATLYDVVVTDTVDSRLYIEGVTTTGGTGGLADWAGQLVTATFASIPHSTQAYITVTARISNGLGADAGEVITNIAEMNHGTAPVTTSNQVSTQVGEPLLVLVKASDPPTSNTVGVGDNITYVVTITNIGEPAGPSPAYDIVFTDTLPGYANAAVPTLLAITLDGVLVDASLYITNYAGGVFTILFDPTFAFSMPVGSDLVIRYVATVDADVGAGLDLTNTAQVSWSSLPGARPGDRDYGPIANDTTLHTVLPDIIKAVTPITASIGAPITYTIRVPETPITATLYNVVVTDQFSPWLELADVVAPLTTTQDVDWGPPAAITITYASIPAGEQRLITVLAYVTDGITEPVSGDLITNVVTLEHDTGITISPPVTVTVVEPALILVKASDPPTSNTVVAGQAVTYTVTVTNIGDSPAYRYEFGDQLPPGMQQIAPTLLSVTIDGAPVAPGGYVAVLTHGSVFIDFEIWTPLPAGSVLEIVYVAYVDMDVSASLDLTNTASIEWMSWPPDVFPVRVYGPISDTTTVHTPQPLIGKVGGPPTLTIGSTVVYTITVPEPPIGATLYNVVVTDVVDSRLRIDAAVNATYSGQIVIATFTSIPSYTQESIIITATVRDLPTVTVGTQITNVALFDYAGNPDGPQPSDVVTVTIAEPAVTLAKSVETPRDPLGAGDLVTYTLTLSNTGDWPAYDLVVTDSLPVGLDFVSDLGATITDPPAAIMGGAYPVYTATQLNVGGYWTITFTARVRDDITAGVTLTNVAWGVYDGQPGDDPDEREYDIPTDTAPVDVGYPALDLVKFAVPSPVEAGGLLTYTLTVTNTGIVSATGVVVTDAVPLNTTYLDCGPLSCGEVSGVVSWTLGTLDVGATRVLTMLVQVDSPLFDGTVLTNTAWVTSTEGITDTDTVTTPVESAHTLAMTKTADPAVVQAGDLLTYTLEWAVSGNEPALGVTISDTIPANTTYWASDPAATSAPPVGAGGLVTWDLGDQNPPASGVLALVVRVDTPLLTGTLLSNAALITDTQGITDTGTVDTPVESAHTLVLIKTADPAVVQAGDLLTYTLEWLVSGNEPALGVTISDTVPVNTAFDSCDGGLTCGESGGLVTWDLGDQNPPASGVVTLVVQVDTPLLTGTVLSNAALITDTQGITDTGTVDTPVESAHTLALTKTADPAVVQAGDLLTYTLEWLVSGNEPALGVTISDTVPANTAFDSCDGGLTCGESGGLVTWDLGDQNPPASGVVTLVVQVDTPLLTGTVLSNAALITDTQGITDTGTVDTPVESAHTLALTKTADPAVVQAGDLLTYTLEWLVSGNEPALGVTISDTVPANTAFDSCDGGLTCGESGGLVTWNLGDQNPPTSSVVTLVVRVDSDAPTGTLLYNAASITDTQGLTDTGEITTPVNTSVEIWVTKTGSSSPVTPGEPMTYSLTITNDGPSDAENVVVTDTLPAEVAFVSADPPEASGPNPLVWNLGTLTPGEIRDIVITVTVYASVTERFTNTVVITTTTPGDDPGNNQDDHPVDVTPLADVTITKSGSHSPAVAGGPLVYTLVYTNYGPSDAQNVVVTDTLPDEVTFVDATPPPNVSAVNPLVWNLGTLTPGDSGQIVITVTINSNVTDTFTNTVVIATGTPESDYDNNDDDEPTDVVPIDEVGILKTVTPFTATIGDIITYTLLFPEPPLAASLDNVTVTDQLSPWLALDTLDTPGGTFEWDWDTWMFTVTYPIIPAGEQRIITVTAEVISDAWDPPWQPVAGDLITNVATLAYGTVVTTSNEVTTTVVEPDLVIVKVSDPPQSSTVGAGQTVTYTVTVTNVGGSPAYSFAFWDELPVGMQATDPTLLSAIIDGSVVDPADYFLWTMPGYLFLSFDNGVLPVGSVLEIIYVGYVDWDVTPGIDLTNTASIDWGSGFSQAEIGRRYPPISDTNTVHVGYPALDLVKSAAPDPVEPGGLLTYTLTVANTGVVSATDVVVTDTIPAHTTFVTATMPHSGPAPDGNPGSIVTWALGTLDVDETRVLTMVVQVDLLLLNGTLVTNTAWLTSTEGLTDTDTVTTPVMSSHSLAITKTASPDPVQAGEHLTYTLTWSVEGNEPALGVTISDTVPANTAFDSCSGGLTCGESGGLVTWDLGGQNPPASGVVTLVVRVDTPLLIGTVLSNAALITDTQGLTDTDTVDTPVESAHTLALTKTADPAVVQAGDLLTYTLAWSVNGNEPTLGVTISDTVPVNTAFDSCSGGLACGEFGGLVTWGLGDQNPPASGVVTLVVRVDSNVPTGTLLYNAASITDTQGLTDTGEITTPVNTSVEIWVTKTGSSSPVTPGEPMTYSLTVANDGPSDAENVVVLDSLPAEVTFVSASPTPDSGPNPLVWNLGTLATGAHRDILITVTVNADVTEGFTNTVIITTTTPGDDPGNNEDDWPVDVVASADLAITKSDSPDPVVPGETLIYTLVYTNYGPSDAVNVIVTDTLPAEVTFVAAAPPQMTGPNPLTWNLGTVVAGDGGRIVITTTVNSDVTAPFTNTVVITSDTPDDNPDDNTDEEPTQPLVPGMELVKTVLPGASVPNMPFTYVITITNTGYVTLDPLVLTDTLPSLDFHYVVGTATPAEPAVIAPPLLVWTDLGPLDPGASVSVTFAVTVTPGITVGTYVNVALATGDHPGGVLTDTDDVPIVIEDPAIALSKHLIGFDTDVWAPNFVTFTIAITNVGLSEIDVLPLYDLYDPFYLHFADAFPVMPDTVDNVNGQVVWFDLTTPAPHGFGRNLLPGEVFSITTVFTVVNEITLPVTNTAVVSDAIDIYDNPTPDEEDEEVIIDIPTAVDLLYFRAVALSEGIRLEWATAVEIDNFGFTLHRATEPDFTRASEIVFIPSACRGNLCGATYDYLDTAVDPDVVYWYWLVDVDTSGVTTRHGPVSGRVYGAALPIRVFLPLVLRNR